MKYYQVTRLATEVGPQYTRPGIWCVIIKPTINLYVLCIPSRLSQTFATKHIDCKCTLSFHRMDGPHYMLPARKAMLRLLNCYYKQELVSSRRQR